MLFANKYNTMEKENRQFKFKIDSFDFRDGKKELEIREKLSLAFGDEEYEILTRIEKKVGISEHAILFLICKNPNNNVFDVIKEYRAD